MAGHKDLETKYLAERESLFRGLKNLDRRSFTRIAGAALGAALGKGLVTPHSFQLVNVAFGASGPLPFTFAYLSDTHIYDKKINEHFVRAALKAVDDVNALDPQPDFVFFGGDLAQNGKRSELELGRQILSGVKAPLKMMVGEHDWFLDMGEAWQEMFGPANYSFDWKGCHCVVLMSVNEQDFWTEKKLTPEQRMGIVAGLDDGRQGRFQVGDAGREWLKNDLAKVSAETPLIVFSHSPLYKYYRDWNFWTEDADQVQALLSPYQQVTVFHGHTHQVLSNRIGNIDYHGFLSTAWPWPYAPSGLPALTVQMQRANPFDPFDACGDGLATVAPGGLVDKVYSLWDRNPMSVKHSYLASNGAIDRPAAPKLPTY